MIGGSTETGSLFFTHNLLEANHFLLVIRNDSLYSKYPGGLERLVRKYQIVSNDYLSYFSGMCEHYLYDLLEELRCYGLKSKLDYLWTMEDLVGKKTVAMWKKEPIPEDLYDFEELCPWLRRYRLVDGNLLSFTGFGIPYLVIKTEADVYLRIEIAFAEKSLHRNYSACPDAFGDYPGLVFIDDPYPFNQTSLRFTAREKVLDAAKNLANYYKTEVWTYLLDEGYYHINKDEAVTKSDYIPERHRVSFNEMRLIKEKEDSNEN